jgi:4-amino-4-deoxy-L-arabinose transferase-like glycosyltransferase
MVRILAQLWKPRLLAAIAIFFYAAVTLDHLTSFPKVGEDEPWIAAAPYKLATAGTYGSDLFAGYYGVERHNYQQMPLFLLIEAGIFKAFGTGVAQMRALPAVFGLCLLIVAYFVGSRIGGPWVGSLAAVLMTTLRVGAVDGGTGIVLLDRARVNRYDIAVPVFGLTAVLMFLRAFDAGARGAPARVRALDSGGPQGSPSVNARLVGCGALAGLASLSHLYGLFWLPAFGIVLVAAGGWRELAGRRLWTIVAGAALTWIPWALYVASGWNDYRGQMRFVAARFDVFNPAFYRDNLLHGAGPISLGWLLDVLPAVPWHRVGTWVALAGTPAAIAVMLRRSSGLAAEQGARELILPRELTAHGASDLTAAHGSRGLTAPQAFALVTIAQFAMFVLLLKVKTYSYMIALWPCVALCLAWGGVYAWERSRTRAARAIVAGVGLAIIAQGGVAIVTAHQEAVGATPYGFYEGEIARCIPPGSRVLGLQHYWLGLRQFDYRTWLMPLNMAHPLYFDHPVPLESAIESIHPDVILVDRYMRDMLGEAAAPAHPNHRYFTGFNAFMAAHRIEHACVIRDRTYGSMEVYLVR